MSFPCLEDLLSHWHFILPPLCLFSASLASSPPHHLPVCLSDGKMHFAFRFSISHPSARHHQPLFALLSLYISCLMLLTFPLLPLPLSSFRQPSNFSSSSLTLSYLLLNVFFFFFLSSCETLCSLFNVCRRLCYCCTCYGALFLCTLSLSLSLSPLDSSLVHSSCLLHPSMIHR